MSEGLLDLSAARSQPANDAEREVQHAVLASLLAAYADGELPAETGSQIDAHLLGCARCRREVGIHRALRDGIGRMSSISALPDIGALEARVRLRLAELASHASLPAPPTAVLANASPVSPIPQRRWPTGARRGWIVASCVLLAMSAIVGRRALVERASANPVIGLSTLPPLGMVVRDYRATMASVLPGRARDLDAVRAAVPFAVEPLRHASLRLLAAWTTSLESQPAAVLAYRWNDRIVLQYVIAEDLLFRHSGMRQALASRGRIAARDGRQGVIAWALPAAGSVLVGDVTSAELGVLWAGANDR